jgi:long-chain acyl-CoA synthetase
VDIPTIFEHMPRRYKKGSASAPRSYYFSVGEHKYTVRVTPEACTVEPGKTVESADVVLKTTPELFEKMVLRGKLPGPIDIATGKIRTNDPVGLSKLREMFDFSGV